MQWCSVEIETNYIHQQILADLNEKFSFIYQSAYLINCFIVEYFIWAKLTFPLLAFDRAEMLH